MTEKKWSQDVTEHSDALDLDEGVFALEDPAEIARSLKRRRGVAGAARARRSSRRCQC